MIKKTILINNSAFLKKQDDQLVIKRDEEESSVPIEDIGVLMLDHWQITVTDSVLNAILANEGIIITCDKTHHPSGVMLPISANSVHAEILRAQMESSLPLRKQLWQQTIKQKILNQAAVLEHIKVDIEPMKHYASKVRSGDPDNYEGRAAAFYWKRVFPTLPEFTRDPEGLSPNHLLNYGYAVLRASVARGIVSSGMHPALGIHHKNKYNSFSLADDLMEPYRPFVDEIVRKMIEESSEVIDLVPETKRNLLSFLGGDIVMEEERKPLQLGITRTCASLVKCFKKEATKMLYPEFPKRNSSDDAPE
ncbi:MAG: type II CRISPR-associated endonuclease Cas1 [Ignavibacteriae bacterium]|nr:type II CRISPR-associated endonuclease Cas1 [Ignavibacteriota bacterium]